MNLGSQRITLGVPSELVLRLVAHWAAACGRPHAAATAEEIAKTLDPGHPDTLVDHNGTPIFELQIPVRDLLVQGVDSARKWNNPQLARQLEVLIRMVDPDPTSIVGVINLSGPIHDQLERVAKLTRG